MAENGMKKHGSPLQQAAARSRRERKQSKFQRHKAGMSPRSAGSPSQSAEPEVSFSEESQLSKSSDHQELDESIDMPDDEQAFRKASVTSVDESMDLPDDEKAAEQRITSLTQDSKASGTNSAFDMRSIHSHPPPTLEPDETTTNINVEGEAVAFTPVDEGFDRHLTETQEEEKKEEESDESEQQPVDPSWDPDHFAHLIQQGVNSGTQLPNDKPQDTSWDASVAVFNEKTQSANNEASKDGIFDMFDTGSWGNSDVSFTDAGGQFLRLLQQSLNPLGSKFTTEQKEVLEDVQRNLELAGSIDRADSKIDIAATPKTGHTSNKSSRPVTDDEPLLGGKLASSSESRTIDMEERVKIYNAPIEPDEESLDGEDVDEEIVDDDGVEDEIGYISQESESDDELEPGPNDPKMTSAEFASLSDHKEAPSLDIAAMASNQSMSQQPPPPPPPREEEKGSQGKRAEKSAKIPLIAPPPEEKLKKWVDEKTRGERHLAAMKKKQGASDIEGPPKVMRTSEPSLFGSPTNLKTQKSPSDKARSPSSMEPILPDKKMAEKIALASSVAAVTFEECLGSSASSPKSSRDKKDLYRSPVTSGAFTNWIDADYSPTRKTKKQIDQQQNLQSYVEERQGGVPDIQSLSESDLLVWLSREVLGNKDVLVEEQANVPLVIQLLLEDDTNFNVMCQYMADSVNNATSEIGIGASFEELTLTSATTQESFGSTGMDSTINGNVKEYLERKRPWLKPMVLSKESQQLAPSLLAANFVSFLYLTSKISKVPSPFGSSNPFLAQIVSIAMDKTENADKSEKGKFSPQQLVFNDPKGHVVGIVQFVYKVCKVSEFQGGKSENTAQSRSTEKSSKEAGSEPNIPSTGNKSVERSRRYIVPDEHPSPFETAVWTAPRIVPAVLSFLGDPVVVCRMKMVNRFCRRIVSENEHMIMQDAVRVGGLSMNVRPAFWMWIALQKCTPEQASKGKQILNIDDLKELHQQGLEGKWNHVIERDVSRSFGNMPPHKTGARLRTDSIVRALVTWGQNRIMKRGVKGGGEETPLPELGPYRNRKQKEKPRRNTFASPPWVCSVDTTSVASETSETPTDTVSDWGGVSPVASMADSVTEAEPSNGKQNVYPKEELALSGNFLTSEMKSDLQSKLSFILNSLAAAHGDVGYCQGMDYVVAHLLRILQDTIRWKAVQGTLPETIAAATNLPDFSALKQDSLPKIVETVDKSLVVEETVFRVMDIFFTNFNLRHMYWPELRCLKTCCRVFEKLIKIKLPVLADHFEHHDLNVGLFALGWFQTLFLYLPSMPSATVCHMWDIWLVERSFKIFFRVGTAILFLSQPILLNHELEGMMTYLNTIPDATLLKPDILIACALNIKVTNRMLQDLEAEVTSADK